MQVLKEGKVECGSLKTSEGKSRVLVDEVVVQRFTEKE